MPKINESDEFKDIKLKLDKSYLIRLGKLVEKIILNPNVGKPMKYERKNTREVYLPPFRISYAYDKSSDTLTFLNVYHKKKQ
ncbi:MAG: type II toxin-antitoxin system RelE/ParE family toxin [Nanoarchaeota archaeon]|nr:type II toxin-antitoxin system RelE/ParE family toxin [Nanoarchaeota archaeon]MBU0978017.1 type II toxin-antitoxin system RelE/ParE family toxin [Nanoarchaeota archaeon]